MTQFWSFARREVTFCNFSQRGREREIEIWSIFILGYMRLVPNDSESSVERQRQHAQCWSKTFLQNRQISLYLGVLQTWNVPFWSPALSRYGKGQRCLRPVITKFWSLEGKEAGNIWTEPSFWNFLILSILTDKPRLPMSELSPIHATLKLWKCNVNMRSAEAKPIFKIDKIVSISGVIRTWFFHFGIRLCDTI